MSIQIVINFKLCFLSLFVFVFFFFFFDFVFLTSVQSDITVYTLSCNFLHGLRSLLLLTNDWYLSTVLLPSICVVVPLLSVIGTVPIWVRTVGNWRVGGRKTFSCLITTNCCNWLTDNEWSVSILRSRKR